MTPRHSASDLSTSLDLPEIVYGMLPNKPHPSIQTYTRVLSIPTTSMEMMWAGKGDGTRMTRGELSCETHSGVHTEGKFDFGCK